MGVAGLRQAIRRRLAGEVPLGEAFFYDMLVIGSIVNIAIGLIAFAMIGADWPVWLPIMVFLSPQPYNILLLIAVWRAATRSQARTADLVKAAAIVWFVAMVFV